jgi:hypothetical protein
MFFPIQHHHHHHQQQQQQQPTTYTHIVLKTCLEYFDWITKDDSWGGELELKYIAQHFNCLIVAIDIQSLQCYAYGESQVAKQVHILYIYIVRVCGRGGG